MAVRLGRPVVQQRHTQLDGFKSRVLQSEASTTRHLYLAEWRSLDAVTAAQSGATLVIGHESLRSDCLHTPSMITL